MCDDKITADEISQWLKTEGKKAAWLAKTLGVTPATVSRWLNKHVVPSGSDAALLRLLIRGDMPFDMINSKILYGVLDFSEDQWRVINTIASRQGLTAAKWIAEKIRWLLAGDNDARKIEADIVAKRHLENANLTLLEDPLKVAEDEKKEGNG